MITSTNLQIEISDNLVQGCMSFELSQPIHGHHFFQASFSGEALENDPMGVGQDSLNHIGQTLKIEFSNTANETSNFKGIITSVKAVATGHSGQGQIIVFKGYSPTILLENGLNSQAYANMKLSDIISQACEGPESNLLKLSVKPVNNPDLAYTVQYNETAFEFANRMARRHGEWLYYDGSELVVGENKQPEVKLIYGSDLRSFDYDMQTSSVVRQFMAHSYSTNQTQDINTKTLQPGTSGAGKQIYNTSTRTWQAPQNGMLVHFGEDNSIKKQLDDVAKTFVEGAAASRIVLNGSSTNPALFPGLNVKIEGFDHRDYGNYIITSVYHQYKVGGDYHNSFTAVPSEVKATPQTNTYLTPRCESQPGIVDDNKDPDGLGRVKVRLYWQSNVITPWLRIVMPYTGGSKGVYFVPEKGEEVMVGFEGGNAEQPFVIGALYHGKADPGEFADDQNNIKAIKTRSEHIIEFNDDENGSWGIIIKDKNGNMIRIDTKGKNIDIIAPETMTLRSKNMVIKVDEHLTIDASNKDETIQQKSNLTINEDYTVKTGKYTETVNGDKEEKIKDSYKHTSSDSKIKTTSGDIKIQGAGVAVFQGAKDVKVSKG
jgi:type VI secretion system secreted protein VgrG